jgi:hypothetical protein
MNRFSDFGLGHASVLGFKVESPAFATLFQTLRKPSFHIHYKKQPAMKQTMSKKYKNYKTTSKTVGRHMFGSLCISSTSLHGIKLNIDT